MNSGGFNEAGFGEVKKEGLIDLGALAFEFCDDALVAEFFARKLQVLGDKEEWLKENAESLEQNREAIEAAVANGQFTDSRPETLWQFQVEKVKHGPEVLGRVKAELMGQVEEIKGEVIRRLAQFLPDWKADSAKIVFTINEKADFCVDGDKITIDLGRLMSEENPVETATAGITHEVVHLWMQREPEWSDDRQAEVSDKSLKRWLIFNTMDEGLAVLISGQSLEKHRAKSGKDFQEYIRESFETFNIFLVEADRVELNKIKDTEFLDMGHFYVVGNEIVKAILQYDGIEKFRGLLATGRDKGEVFLQRYAEICKGVAELPKIDWEGEMKD